MHMIRKGQFAISGADAMSFADQFYALAGKVRPQSPGQCPPREIPPFNQQRDTITSNSSSGLPPGLSRDGNIGRYAGV